jgi:hypothetical protein
MSKEVPFEIEKLKHTERTVTSVSNVMLHCWHYDVYELSTGMLILVQANEHGMIEPIFVSFNMWHAITCLIWGVHCGSG